MGLILTVILGLLLSPVVTLSEGPAAQSRTCSSQGCRCFVDGLIDYMKNGIQSTVCWPETTPKVSYDTIIEFGYTTILGRSADPVELAIYNKWFQECYADPERSCFSPFIDVLAASDEYVLGNQ